MQGHWWEQIVTARRKRPSGEYGCGYCERDFETRTEALKHVRGCKQRKPEEPIRVVRTTRVGRAG